MTTTLIENQTFDEERALYGKNNLFVKNCRFDGPRDGESAFKECSNIQVENCYMNLRYPYWHVSEGKIKETAFTENCRAALWYDKNISIENCTLNGIKALRECSGITIKNSSVNSPEFIWKCDNLCAENLNVEHSEYPFFELSNARFKNLSLHGKYSFQYNRDILIEDSNLDTKDAFWHAKNVTIKNSTIKSEYLAWYSENLTFINCRIIGTQPFCYCKKLVLENCTMENCDLSFERSTVKATVNGKIDSVKNVLEGSISCGQIGELIMEKEITDPSRVEIICTDR